MQVALALRIHAIWSVVEKFLVLLSQIALETRNYLYKLFKQISSWMNEVPVPLVK